MLSVVRLKVAAVLLGPLGVGLAGVLGSIMTTASSLSGLGLSTSGVREVAASASDPQRLAEARRAVFWAHVALAFVGAGSLWLLRSQVAGWVFGDAGHGNDVGWLAVGVGCSVVAGSQVAALQGLRRMGDIARASVLGATLGALIGVVILWVRGESGVPAFVISGPVASVLAALPFVARLPRPRRAGAGPAVLIQRSRSMVALGLVTMSSALMGNLCQLLVRSLITRELGIDATGHFHAAWTISMTYLGFVLGAMGADYYPRLAEAIVDRELANRLVSEQTEVALLLAGPAIIGMLALAPWLIPALYSSQFGEAVSVLRWQILGDILKVAAWPMSYVLLARGRPLPYFLTELLWVFCYCGFVWLGLPVFGIEATGMAFLASYAVSMTVVFLTVRRLQEFRWTRFNAAWTALLLIAGALVAGLATRSPRFAAAVGCVFAGGLAVFSFRVIARLDGVRDRLARARDRLGL